MEKRATSLELGTILCKHCGEIIGTIDSKRVMKYYSECQDAACQETRRNKMRYVPEATPISPERMNLIEDEHAV